MEYVDLVNVTPIRVAINTETIPGLGYDMGMIYSITR